MERQKNNELGTVALSIIKREVSLAQEANKKHDVVGASKHRTNYQVMVNFAQELGIISKDIDPYYPKL